MSDSLDVPDGVPEGSILGPLLYSVGQVDVGCCSELAQQRVDRLHQIDDQVNGAVDTFPKMDVDQEHVEYADDCSALLAAYSIIELQISLNVLMEEFLASYCAKCLQEMPNKNKSAPLQRISKYNLC